MKNQSVIYRISLIFTLVILLSGILFAITQTDLLTEVNNNTMHDIRPVTSTKSTRATKNSISTNNELNSPEIDREDKLTVGELIEKLQDYDPKKEIVIYHIEEEPFYEIIRVLRIVNIQNLKANKMLKINEDYVSIDAAIMVEVK